MKKLIVHFSYSSPACSLLAALLLALAFQPLPAWGCHVPIYQNALQNWPAAPYELLIFCGGPAQPADQAMVASLKNARGDSAIPLNLHVRWVDTTNTLSDADAAVLKGQNPPELPWAVLSYPNQSKYSQPGPQCSPLNPLPPPTKVYQTTTSGAKQTPPVWAGRLDVTELRKLSDSPARLELSRRLRSGQAAVWVLVVGGDPRKDVEAQALLEAQLQMAEKSIAPLPMANPCQPNQPPNQADSKLPARIVFSMLKVSRSDVAEQSFIRLLCNAFDLCAYENGPIAFPVFGQGRVLNALALAEDPPNEVLAIRRLCEFLTGCCLCRVRFSKPGFDLLLHADWRALDEAQPEVKPAPLAALAVPVSPRPRIPEAIPASAPAGSFFSLKLAALAGAILLALALLYMALRWNGRRT